MKKYKVLIVDDNRLYRKKIVELKYFAENKNRFEIFADVPNGSEALEILYREKIDVCLTDINMPKTDGRMLLKEIHRGNLCPVTVFISGYPEFEYAVEGLEYNLFDYLVKPIEEEKFSRTMNRILKHLDGEVKKDSFWCFKADSIVKSILSGDWMIDGVIYDFIEILRGQEISLGELGLEINHILKYVGDHCLSSKPFIRHFSMLEEITHVEGMMYTAHDELLELLNRRFKMLYDEFNKLNLYTENQLLRNISQYIIDNIESNINLERIAEEFLINSKYLSTLFKKETRVGFTDYVSTVKIERGKVLLRRRNLKVNQVASLLGYEDVGYFSRIFKEKTGFLPSVYGKIQALPVM